MFSKNSGMFLCDFCLLRYIKLMSAMLLLRPKFGVADVID